MKLRLLVLASIVTINALAQSYYGGLGGTVLDQNGGALSSAKVTLINEGTNAQRSSVTASAGEFEFSELVPGSYGLVVEAPGFKKFEQKGIIIGTQQQVSVDAKLQLGQAMRYVGQQCIQLHGGIGVTDEYIASHYFKRLTVMEMTYGDTLHQLGEVSARMQNTAGVFA